MARVGQQKALFIELNALNQNGDACRVTFVMVNNMKTAIDELILELVLFDQAQQVQSLLTLKTRNLPAQKTLVRRYDLKKISCQSIQRILVNEIKVCRGKSLGASGCLKALSLSSRTKAKLGL